jgi:hypothetical protein
MQNHAGLVGGGGSMGKSASSQPRSADLASARPSRPDAFSKVTVRIDEVPPLSEKGSVALPDSAVQ